MKKIILLSLALCLAGCNMERNVSKTSPSENNTIPASAASHLTAASNADKILGSFVGAFGDNKITLLITKVADGSVSGRSVVGGNDRPFEGSYALENAVYNVTGIEPGDHKDDGIFKFTIAEAEPDKVTGTWKANDAKRPEKSYTLDRKKFEYRADVGSWPEASQRLLKAADVENLVKPELQLMRNEIFARHGYCFNKKDMRQQFENEEWYVPNTVDIKGYLTDIEKKNIALIKRYEKYADDYGDEYGR